MPGDSTSRDIPYWENDTAAVVLAAVSAGGGNGDPSRYFGRVIYAHGFGVDHPVFITRYNYVYAVDLAGNLVSPPAVVPWVRIMPFWDALGDAALGAFTSGVQKSCKPATSTTACIGVTWPYLFHAYDREHGITRDNWHGSLLESARDKSGLQFMRNRYYDPNTGRFTQEDPLGLAGGLNLYGFAGGDPLNFSDPFGLFECEKLGNCTQSQGGRLEVARTVEKREERDALIDESANTFAVVSTVATLGAGAVEGFAAGSTEGTIEGAGGRILANKAKGDLFRDEIAKKFEEGGYQVEKEVTKHTPFGPRRIDIQVSKGGKVLGGLETKAGPFARYNVWQRAKDAWLKLEGYIVQVVRDR